MTDFLIMNIQENILINKDLIELKKLIKNNVQIFLLIDFINMHKPKSDENVVCDDKAESWKCIVDKILKAANVDVEKTWYAEINILYSSITLIYEYIKADVETAVKLEKGEDINAKIKKMFENKINDLDKEFNSKTWFINKAVEFDDNDTPSDKNLDLAKIIKRMRNSISHGRYELIINSDDARESFIIFNDVDPTKKANSTEKNFRIIFKVMNLQKFIGKLERSFDLKYSS